MALPEIGTYIAGLLEWSVNQPEGKCPSFDVNFECRQKLEGGSWAPANGERITQKFNLVKNDGNLNEINVRNLKTALTWDGTSFTTLNDGPWSDVEVQIVVAETPSSSGDGKMYKEVKYINPRDYSGQSRVGKADAQTITSLDQKYGSMLRALSGTKPAAANGKPAPQVKPSPAASSSPSTAETEKGKCWKAFSDVCDEYTKSNPAGGYDAGKKLEVFKKLIGNQFPGKESKNLTAHDWQVLHGTINKDFSPELADLIPF